MNYNLWDSFFNQNEGGYDRFKNQWDRIFPTEHQLWGVKNPVWVDTNDAWRLFLEIPELRQVLDKRASMMSSNKPCLYNKDGEKVTDHWLNSLIQNPNPSQSWADVVYSIAIMDGLYSNAFAYSPERSLGIHNLIVPVPSDKIQLLLSGKRLKQMDQEGLIDGYKFQYDDNKIERIDTNDMLYFMTPDGMNLVNPSSRIEALKYPLSNLRAQYHKRNVLLENMGAIGILSAQQNDQGGAIPLTPEEKKQIQKDWYKRSKDEIMITETSVNWVPMSYPTRDLLLFEEQTADKIALVDAYGLNYNIFSTEKGATFSNVRDSLRMVYNDTIIPETQQIYDTIIKSYGLDVEGYYLKAEFNHLAILQTDEESKANVMKTRAETLEKIVSLGVELSQDEIKDLIKLNNENMY